MKRIVTNVLCALAYKRLQTLINYTVLSLLRTASTYGTLRWTNIAFDLSGLTFGTRMNFSRYLRYTKRPIATIDVGAQMSYRGW